MRKHLHKYIIPYVFETSDTYSLLNRETNDLDDIKDLHVDLVEFLEGSPIADNIDFPTIEFLVCRPLY